MSAITRDWAASQIMSWTSFLPRGHQVYTSFARRTTISFLDGASFGMLRLFRGISLVEGSGSALAGSVIFMRREMNK